MKALERSSPPVKASTDATRSHPRRRRLVASAIGALSSFGLVLAVGVTPAYAGSESGGAFVCTPRVVYTYTFSYGYTYHRQSLSIGDVWRDWYFYNPTTKYWTVGAHNIISWYISGDVLETENSGVTCL